MSARFPVGRAEASRWSSRTRRRQRERRWHLAVRVQVVDDLDRAFLELAIDVFGFERIEPQRLEHFVQLRLPDPATFLADLDERAQLIARQHDIDVDDQSEIPGSCREQRRTIIDVMSSDTIASPAPPSDEPDALPR